MRSILSGILFVLLITNSPAYAQFFQYNHPELEWRSFDTEHFKIHFHKGTKRSALLAAKIAEEIYPHVTGLYNYEPKNKIHFVIKDTDDYANGAAFFFDNKVEIFTTNLDYIMRGTKNWLRDVITHEYTHMISIQKMIKSSILFPYGFFQVFTYEKEKRKDVVRGFPNTLVSYPISSVNIPVWFAEGTAQHQADGSRYDYRDPHREMILRDRVLNNSLLTYNAMGVFGKTSLGNESSYNLGLSFVNYLTNRFGEKILEDITQISSKWTSYTFEGVLESAAGIPVNTLYADWKDSLETVYKSRTKNIRNNLIKGNLIDKEGSANIYPVWSPDGLKIAYISNSGEDYFSKNHLVVYDKIKAEKKNLVPGISSSLSWSPDGRYIAYARQKTNNYGSSYNDLYLYDLQEEEEIRLTKGLRGGNPDFSHDGNKLAFVTVTNGLHQLNIYRLPENLKSDFSKTIYFDIETGKLNHTGSDDITAFRKVRYRGGEIKQVLIFKNERQIFHPRWQNDDSKIVFDTAIEYGRNLGIYDLQKNEYRLFLSAEEELRYPAFQPDSPYMYYAASSTGIYNIYRYNLETAEKILITNITGGAMMPSVNKNGCLIYSCYDSLGYRIYELDNPQKIDMAAAEYNPDYIQSIPDKNFDNTINEEPEIKPYRQTFADNLHILPRLLIDYETIKPGLYVISSDVLDKYLLIGGAAVNSDFDYDLYGYFEIKKFKPTIFFEAYNSTANIADTLNIDRGGYTLQFNRKVNFNLTEFRGGVSGRVFDTFDYRAAYVLRRYNAKIDQDGMYDEIGEESWLPFTFHYNYLKGYAFEWSVFTDMVHSDRNKNINPSAGRYVFFKHSFESNDFIEDFALSEIGLKEVYKNYSFHQLTLDWEEFFKNPFLNNHALSLRLRAGYIDRPVDSFFNLFAGGLLGMKGYSYFSVEGRNKLIGSACYRFPLLQNIDARLGHLYFAKLYFGVFYDYGNAWSGKEIDWMDFKRDIGFQLRLDTFSYYLFPTRFFAEAVYPLDEVVNHNVTYQKDWRFYFGALFEFDIRERMGGLMHGNLFKRRGR